MQRRILRRWCRFCRAGPGKFGPIGCRLSRKTYINNKFIREFLKVFYLSDRSLFYLVAQFQEIRRG